MRILVTGAAGFIGFHVAQRLLERGDVVIGLDNLNDYYDVSLKQSRLDQLTGNNDFRFHRIDLADQSALTKLFDEEKPDGVIHMAAQAGVRYSLENPHAYVNANLVGFVNLLEECRRANPVHLVYASSSSVYGANTKVPFSVQDATNHPVSLYGATKKANEVIAHSYSHLYGLPMTGLRFFTVYGPWGRPDMAYFKFTKAILAGEPIDVYGHGQMRRDFTYIDDIVTGVVRTFDKPAEPNPEWTGDNPDAASSSAPFRIYNIGNHRSVELTHMIEVLEELLERKANKRLMPPPPGDVPATFADVADLQKAVDFRPDTPIEEGLARFVEWYRGFYGVWDRS